jgi:hypothetical protein
MKIKYLVSMNAFGYDIKEGEIYEVDYVWNSGTILVNDFLLEPGEYERVEEEL